MKLVLSILLLLAFVQLRGQEPIEVKIEDRPSSLGVYPAFEVLVPQATTGEAIDFLKKTIGSRGLFKRNPKLEKVKDEWHVDDVLINSITSKPLDLITQISSFPGHIYVRMFFQNNGKFLGAESDTLQATEAALEFVREYGVDLYILAVEKELKEEERELRKLEKDLKRLSRQNNNYEEKIDDAQSEQKTLDDETDYQRADLRNAKRSEEVSGEALEEMEKELKSAEKELKKAKRYEARFERKSDKNEKEHREISRLVSKQEEVIERVKEKLENIR